MDSFRNNGEPPTFSSQPRGLSEYYRARTTPDNGYGMQNQQGMRPQSFGGGGGEVYPYQQQPQPQGQSRPAPQPQPPKQQEQWMVAVNGQQYGPYEPRLIEGMITSRQIDPATAYAWKQGLPNWVPFQQVPELAALVPPPAAAVAPPTPPMGGGATAAPTMPSAPSAPTVSNGAGNSVPSGASGSMANTVSSSPRPAQSAPQAGTFQPASTRVSTGTPASVDLNSATVEQLLTLPEFTLPLAEQLVSERQQRGGFQSVEQVAQFLNLKPHQADKLARSAVLHPYQGARTSSGGMSSGGTSSSGTISSTPQSGRVVDF